jgi:hypothetical protein
MFGISTNGLPRIRDYAAAKLYFDSITPIRGGNSGIRPIGKRSKNHMQIVEGNNERGPYYAAKLYDTECVRWYENGGDDMVQVRCGGWTSQSSAAFIGAVSVYATNLQNNHLWVNGHAMHDTQGGLWFEGESYKQVCLNPPKYYVAQLNPETTKHIRNLPAVKAMQSYLKHMAALGAYENVKATYMSKQTTQTCLAEILARPTNEPDLEVLARLGDAVRGPVDWALVYDCAVSARVVTREELRLKHYITDNVNRKGVQCE